VTVFYQVWDNPLSTLSNASLIGNMIETCGGSNLFGEQPSVVVQVDREQVIAYNPDVILTSAKAGVSDQAWQEPWLHWPAINAVKFGHMWALPGDLLSRHTARAFAGAEQMCNLLEQARASPLAGE
jgi:iron complex transport system substrate-binding protein